MKHINDCRRTKVKDLVHKLCKLILADFCRSEGFNKNGNRLCNADCIGELNLAF